MVRIGAHEGPVIGAVAFAFMCFGLVGTCVAAPQTWSDVFNPNCGNLTDDHPPEGWMLWSQPETWGQPAGVPPGTGIYAGKDVVIPCGFSVILDVDTIDVRLLDIRGHLKFLDFPVVGQIRETVTVNAKYVLVQGQLTIGAPDQPFQRRAIITLYPNVAEKRAPLLYTQSPPADPLNPRNLGHKVFAVVGGVVNLHGMPSANNVTGPAWCRLTRDALPGMRTIFVDCDASSWAAGDRIVVATSGFSPTASEVMVIRDVAPMEGGGSRIDLEGRTGFRFRHYGELVYQGQIDVRAEVALLDRRILIRGLEEKPPYNLEGGHFMVFRTSLTQVIEGVQFLSMGQQGNVGRYPLHFHLCKTSLSLIRKNVILNSKQRCVVIHGTSNATIEENVAYNTIGHCFLLEDGDEQYNKFYYNLGILANPPLLLLPPKPTLAGYTVRETDTRPSTFWMSNPLNDFIGNVAVGSAFSGFWPELNDRVRGDAMDNPAAFLTSPDSLPFGTFQNNVAHSNLGFAYRTYPHGIFIPYITDEPYALDNFTLYHNFGGILLRNNYNVIVRGAKMWDNYYGMRVTFGKFVRVQNSLIVGAASPCKGPGQPVSRLQYVGISVGQDFPRSTSFPAPTFFSNIKFDGFSYSCNVNSAAFLLSPDTDSGVWNTATGSSKLEFAPGTNRITFDKVDDIPRGASVRKYFVFNDKDGTMIGAPGYVVPNYVPLLPPNYKTNCTFYPTWRSFGCPGTCYRLLQVVFVDMGARGDASYPFPYSQVELVRLSDGVGYNVSGPDNIYGLFNPAKPEVTRYIQIPIPAGYRYSLRIISSPFARGFFPTLVSLRFYERTSSCTDPVSVLLLPSAPSLQWSTTFSKTIIKRDPCTDSPTATTTNVYTQCPSGVPSLTLVLGYGFTSAISLSQALPSAPETCPSSPPCSGSARIK